MEKALSAPQKVENAVLPIYWTLRSPTKPEQVASGVVVRIKTEYFIFSASHVFDDIKEYALLVGTGEGRELVTLSGERFSTKRGVSGTHKDDPMDASVFHIKQGITETIMNVALSLENLDFKQPDTLKSVHMAAGFRVKKSNVSGNQSKTKRECFPSIEYAEEEYSCLNIDKSTHIALAYEDQILMDNKWQTSPRPKGISGGAIIKVQGVKVFPPLISNSEPKQLLSAITIAQRREHKGKLGVLIGTRINVHLSLIEKYLPNLIDLDNIDM